MSNYTAHSWQLMDRHVRELEALLESTPPNDPNRDALVSRVEQARMDRAAIIAFLR